MNTKVSVNERVKVESRGLRGPLAEELADPATPFSEAAVQVLKHHGAYQQDDRDTRTARKKAGLPAQHTLMVRARLPAGRLTAEQYLVCDALADRYGQGDLRLTSRQAIQWHGVVKGDLRPLVRDLNVLAHVTTRGACGDVVRNVTASPVADLDPRYGAGQVDLVAVARTLSDRFAPRSGAYAEIFLDDAPWPAPEVEVEEPLYGAAYLPRKLKIGLTTPADNSIDVLTNDVAVLATADGLEVLVGGGLGHTHRKPATYARLATPLAFVAPDALGDVIEAIVRVQRDHGDRTDRRHARLKYTVGDLGEVAFRARVEAAYGGPLPPPRGLVPAAQPDHLGWHDEATPGLRYLGLWVESGRVRGAQREALREVISRFRPEVRITAQQNLILARLPADAAPEVDRLLARRAVPTLRRREMACPALPLCGLAMAEAERAMPALMGALEASGHGDSDVVVRVSGCPNSCSRPLTAELGVVGCGADLYQILAGGDEAGTRLASVWRERVAGPDLPAVIGAALEAWSRQRDPGERFGDWAHRVGADSPGGP